MLKYAFCLCLLVPFALRAQTPDSTVIEGFFEGLQPGKARLVATYGDYNYLIDSTVVDAAGHLVLRRKAALPAGFYYFLLPGNKSFSLMFDTDDQHVTLRGNAADFTGTMQVQGSDNSRLLYESMRFQNQQEPELKQLADVMRTKAATSPEYQQAKARQTEIVEARKTYLDGLYKSYPRLFFTKFKISGQNPDWVEFRKPNGDIDTARQVSHFRSHFWDGVDFSDERLLRTPVIANKLRKYIVELTPQHPDSLVLVSDHIIRRVLPYKPYFQFFANWIALQHENGKTKVMDGEAVYVHIIKNFFKPGLAYWDKPENLEKLQKHAWEMEASLLGRKGPDVRAQDLAGNYKSIYEMKAPIVVVFMFSPDCEHCREQAPKIKEVYAKWKDRGVDFYGIAVNTTDAEWRAFMKEENFAFTNVFDPTNRAIYAKYFVDNTPELYVLNKDRVIVAKNLNADQLETIFERELRKLNK
jgi:peroxiredoxin